MCWAGGLGWCSGLVGCASGWAVGWTGCLGWRPRLVGWPGGQGWWIGLEGIFNIFKILTFFNAFLKHLKGWAGGQVARAGGLGWRAGLVAWAGGPGGGPQGPRRSPGPPGGLRVVWDGPPRGAWTKSGILKI